MSLDNLLDDFLTTQSNEDDCETAQQLGGKFVDSIWFELWFETANQFLGDDNEDGAIGRKYNNSPPKEYLAKSVPLNIPNFGLSTARQSQQEKEKVTLQFLIIYVPNPKFLWTDTNWSTSIGSFNERISEKYEILLSRCVWGTTSSSEAKR